MRVIKAFISFLIIISSLTANSQEIEYSPKEYISEDGTIYWNKNLPLYIRVSPYADGQGHLLKSKNPQYANPIYLDTEGVNYIRTRYAVDKESKKIASPLTEVLMPVIADGTGPNSKITFKIAPHHTAKGLHYYGKDLRLQIESVDKHAGVDFIMQQMDNNGYTDYYTDMEVNVEGPHVISYYGVDRVGNKEKTNTKEFIVDLSPPSVTHNINGFADNNVIASTSKMYFTGTDDLSGVYRIYYRFDDQEYRIYNGSNVDFTKLEDGDHILEYYAVDHVKNESGVFTYNFYFDKTAPLTASDILGDRFVVKDKVYFSGRTKMKLTAVDNKIGVKEIRYSIDNSDFELYDQPFYLPSIPGEHSIKYYSLDRLSNRPAGSESYKHNISLVYLDLTGPTVSHRLRGPSFKAAGVQYIGPETQIEVKGIDKESGLQYLTYSLDGDASEQVYTQPFTINNSGDHKIEFFGYDNVNNRNIAGTEVSVDATPPTIYETYSSRSFEYQDGYAIYPHYVTLFLAATDDIVGNDKIYYSINGAKERLYTKPLTDWAKDKIYTIGIRAIDKVGNEAKKEIAFKTSTN